MLVHLIYYLVSKGNLTLIHSERLKLYTIVYNFGLSERNRVKILCLDISPVIRSNGTIGFAVLVSAASTLSFLV